MLPMAGLYPQSHPVSQTNTHTRHELNTNLTTSLNIFVGNIVELADEPVKSALQDADLCHIMAAVLAGWGCTVAAVYTIALFDQNP